MRLAFFLFAVAFGLFATLHAEPVTIRSAQLWPDTAGQHINAHCGSIVRAGDQLERQHERQPAGGPLRLPIRLLG